VLEENKGAMPPFKLVLEEYKGLDPPFKLVLGEAWSCSLKRRGFVSPSDLKIVG